MSKESENQPQEKKITIPKEGDIFKALTEHIEKLKKEEVKIPIEREDFLLRILDDKKFYQQKVNGLNDAINEMLTCEAIGVKLSFYELAKSRKYGFDIRRKQVGFVFEKNNKK